MREIAAGGFPATADYCDDNPTETLELLHMHADVEPDGSSAMLTIHTTEGRQDMSCTIEQMAATVSEMREAGALMMHRQLGCADKGRSAFEEMIRRAPPAAALRLTICRTTGDVIIVFRFADRMPFSVRVAQDKFFAARAEFSSEIKRSSN